MILRENMHYRAARYDLLIKRDNRSYNTHFLSHNVDLLNTYFGHVIYTTVKGPKSSLRPYFKLNSAYETCGTKMGPLAL